MLTVVTDECESVEDVMITHLCASEPLSSSRLALRDDDRTLKSYANQMRLETHLHTIRPVDHQV